MALQVPPSILLTPQLLTEIANSPAGHIPEQIMQAVVDYNQQANVVKQAVQTGVKVGPVANPSRRVQTAPLLSSPPGANQYGRQMTMNPYTVNAPALTFRPPNFTGNMPY